MRAACFWLMIVLMPLRAWAGDAMAVQMAMGGHSHHASAEVVVVAVAVAVEGVPADAPECHGHVDEASNEAATMVGAMGSGGHAGHAASDGHNCLHCDICQGKAHAVHLSVAPFSGTERELPTYGGTPMDPGPAASVFKPPIV
jgi:hypothetical protein